MCGADRARQVDVDVLGCTTPGENNVGRSPQQPGAGTESDDVDRSEGIRWTETSRTCEHLSERRWRQTDRVKHSSELFIDASADAVVAILSDLSTYPSWNDLVGAAEAIDEAANDPGPAWRTTLTAKVGPFARSKQLRFVRDTLETTGDTTTIRFSRRELDGRTHAAWTMHCTVTGRLDRTVVVLTLSYDGGLWVPALGGVLDGAIDRATRRLPDYVQGQL